MAPLPRAVLHILSPEICSRACLVRLTSAAPPLASRAERLTDVNDNRYYLVIECIHLYTPLYVHLKYETDLAVHFLIEFLMLSVQAKHTQVSLMSLRAKQPASYLQAEFYAYCFSFMLFVLGG